MAVLQWAEHLTGMHEAVGSRQAWQNEPVKPVFQRQGEEGQECKAGRNSEQPD